MNLWKKSHKKSHLVEKSQKSDELLQKRHKLVTKIPRTCPTSEKKWQTCEKNFKNLVQKSHKCKKNVTKARKLV